MYESSIGDETSFRNSSSGKTDVIDQNELAAEGCRDILDRMVDPAIEMCVVSSEGKQRLRPTWDREVFIINAMSYLQVRLWVILGYHFPQNDNEFDRAC